MGQDPARPKPGDPIALAIDVPDKGAIVRDFTCGSGLFSLIVTRDGEHFAAFQNVCPHARQRLDTINEKVLVEEGAFLVCAAHGASFSLRDGACVGGPAKSGLTRFAITLRDGVIVAA